MSPKLYLISVFDCFSRRKDTYILTFALSNGELWQKFRTSVNQVVMQPRNVKVYIEPIDTVTLEFIER